jgi:hypothetical protein
MIRRCACAAAARFVAGAADVVVTYGGKPCEA